MDTSSARAFLIGLLERQQPGPSDIDALIVNVPKEGQHIDYKSGKIKDPQGVIRKWVTGFANADGGTLVLGVTEDAPRKIDGFKAPGRSTPSEWASNILTPMAGFFSPHPAIHTVSHTDGDVLLIAVGRAPQLIPYFEEGTFRYAIRIGESTPTVPEFLISDLLLGRRNHPNLEVIDARFQQVGVPKHHPDFVPTTVVLSIENLSLMPSDETIVGTIAWTLSKEGQGVQDAPQAFSQYVDFRPPPTSLPGFGWRLNYHTLIHPIRPFSRIQSSHSLANLPRMPAAATIHFAIYLLPKFSPPTLFAAKSRYSIDKDGTIGGPIKLTRVVESRPLATWFYP